MKTPFNTYRSARAIPARKIPLHIQIVGSSNPRLNAMAKDSQLTLLSVLRNRYTHVAITIVNNMADLKKLVAKKPDLVVLGMKLVLLDPTKSYDDSPKVWLSAYLEQNGITYTGSDTRALSLEFDKHIAKQAVIAAGLQSSRYFISTINEPTFDHNLTYPLFVKPSNRGDSKGIDERSVVYTALELKAKIKSIHSDYSSDALIEEYLPGREFSVAVIRQPHTGTLVAMPVEITTPADKNGNSILSEAVKDADTEQVVRVVDTVLKNRLNSLAIGVFRALGSRDYGRIDMRLDANGHPSFIEANLMPGLSNHGYLSKCFYLNHATTYNDMILAIVALGAERVIAKQQAIVALPVFPQTAQPADISLVL